MLGKTSHFSLLTILGLKFCRQAKQYQGRRYSGSSIEQSHHHEDHLKVIEMLHMYPDLEEFGNDYGLAIIHYLGTVSNLFRHSNRS